MEDSETIEIEEQSDEKSERRIVKNAVDLQRLKIEKLMKNPEKPILIPEIPKEKDFVYSVPTFVRNVMGSSAGAGSGEFHVYRNLRRKEYARQKIIEMKSFRENLDQDYRDKIEKNRLDAEAKTAKKRAKRLKKKKNQKRNKKTKVNENEIVNDEPDFTESEEDSDEEKEKDNIQSNTTPTDNEIDMEKNCKTEAIQYAENKPDNNSDKVIELNENDEKESNEKSEKESNENLEKEKNQIIENESNQKAEKESIEICEIDEKTNCEKIEKESNENSKNKSTESLNKGFEKESNRNFENESNNDSQKETIPNNKPLTDEKLKELDEINPNIEKKKKNEISKNEISNDNN